MVELSSFQALSAGLRPLANLSSPREVVRQFTPNWFTVTMGTGILGLALNQFPLASSGLHAVAEGLWMLNIGLFSLFVLFYGARWVMFTGEAARIFGHSVVSMFFGAIPMSLATIINGLLAFGPGLFGADATTAWAEGLWWADVALSLVCGVAIPFMMFTRQRHSVDQMTAVWLLPVVAAEVAAVSGGLLAPRVADPDHGFGILAASYALWAYSVPIALSILVILVLRMAVHKLPHASMAASSWLALGPIGTGSLGLMVLGAAAPRLFAAHGLASIGSVAAGIGVVGGLALWGYGVWWLLLGVLITLRYLRDGLPFNIGWWGYTFPVGVYAVATLRLGSTLHLGPMIAAGGVLVVALAAMWVVVAARTLAGAWSGRLFVAPCLSTVE